MIRAHPSTCWCSENVGRVQEILGDNTQSTVELAHPPAVNVELLEPKHRNKATVRTAAAVKATGRTCLFDQSRIIILTAFVRGPDPLTVVAGVKNTLVPHKINVKGDTGEPASLWLPGFYPEMRKTTESRGNSLFLLFRSDATLNQSFKAPKKKNVTLRQGFCLE